MLETIQQVAFSLSDLSGLPSTDPGSGKPWIDPISHSIIVGALGTFGLTQAAADARYQLLDADLTAIAALTTTTFGRSLLTQADAAATRSTVGAFATSGGTISGNVQVNASVGIGIAPTAPLHIATSFAVTNFVTMPFVNWVNTLNSSTQGHCNFRMDTTHASASVGFVFANAGTTKFDVLIGGSPGTFLIRDAVNGFATAMQLTAGTGLGVGMAPTCRLDVSGAVRIGGFTFATVPSASASTGQTIRITDRSHRLATSDGTNWNWTGTTTPIS